MLRFPASHRYPRGFAVYPARATFAVFRPSTSDLRSLAFGFLI